MQQQNHDSCRLDSGTDDDLDRSLRLFDDGKDQEAIQILVRIWKGGCFAAAHMIGTIKEMRENGDGTSLSEAEVWYSRAFEAHPDDETQFSLAKIILKIRSNNSKLSNERLEFAVNLLDQMCERKNPKAAIYPASHLFNGNIISENIHKDEELCEMAAEHGHVCVLMMLRDIKFKKGVFIINKIMGNVDNYFNINNTS